MNKETICKCIEEIVTEIDIVAAKIEEDSYQIREICKNIDDLNWTLESYDYGRNEIDLEDFRKKVIAEYAISKGLYELWFLQIRKLLINIDNYRKNFKKGNTKEEIEEIYQTLIEVYNDLNLDINDDICDIEDLINLLDDIKEKLTDLIE